MISIDRYEWVVDDFRQCVACAVYANLIRGAVLLIVVVEKDAYFLKIFVDQIEGRRFGNTIRVRDGIG